MKNTQINKAFSIIEVIIVISVVVLLAVVALNANTSYKEKANTVKVEADSKTLKSSFEEYFAENNTLPMPGWNNNFFKDDWSYWHAWSATNFWVHGYVTTDTLPNKYINYLPLDPKTNQFYAYGKTLTWVIQFEIASVVWKNSLPETKLEWNYPWVTWPISLIREYNWPNFVMDKSKTSFPYNPEELLLTAKINSYSSGVTINGSSLNIENTTLVSWDEIVVSAGWYAELYFSDGSSSVLWDTVNETKLVLADMAYKTENNLITKIKLALDSGTLWVNATNLNDESEFDVFTADASAAVRWTVFWVSKVNENTTNITVEVWKVEVAKVSLEYWEDLVSSINSWVLDTTPITSDLTTITQIDETTWESYIDVSETESPKWINITTEDLSPTSSTLDKYNYDLTSLDNVNLKLKSITQSWSTHAILTFEDRDIYTWAYMLVWDGTTSATINTDNCNSDDLGFTCTTDTNSWAYNVKICKDIQLWERNKLSCTNPIGIDLWLEAEKTPEAMSEERKNNLNFYDDNTCSSNSEYFIWIWCVEVDSGLVTDWYSLVAYAPYNVSKGINMYKSTGDVYNIEFNNLVVWTWTYSTWTLNEKNYNISTIYWKIWVYLDNSDAWWDDFLKYTFNEELSWDFAIEMSVRGAALKREWWKYNLLNLIQKNNTNNYTISWSITNLYSTWLTNIQDNSFYKVILSYDSSNWTTLKIWNDYVYHSGSLTLSWWSELYIWSTSSSTSQWNDIIDYVKIYKK